MSKFQPIRNFSWHTLLLTALPVLSLFVAGVSHFHWSELFLPIGIIWGCCALVLLPLSIWLKSIVKASLVVSFGGFFILQFTNFKEIIISPGADSLFGEIYLIGVLAIALLLLFYLKQKKPVVTKFNKVLNLFAVVLIGFQLVNWYNKDNRKDLQAPGLTNFLNREIQVEVEPDSLSNFHILYLVLDEYGRSDRLKADYGIDNQSFINYLEEAGFQVCTKSRSNYWSTAYSMASALNMDYLDTLPSIYGKNEDNWRILHHCINNARLFTLMRKLNIPIYTTNTTLSEHVQFEKADEVIQLGTCPRLYDLNYIFWQRSVLGKFQSFWKTSSNRRYEEHARQINDGFEALKRFYSKDHGSKSFVYAHFMVPHPPFVFDKEGRVTTHEVLYPGHDYNLADEDWNHKYADQLAYVNEKVKEVIEVALRDTTNTPIIVIQGDHGARRDWEENKAELDVESFNRFTNLSAFLLPYVRYSIDDELTMVNTWPMVLNHYFKTDLIMKDDRNFSIDKKSPLLMEDITSILDSLERNNP